MVPSRFVALATTFVMTSLAPFYAQQAAEDAGFRITGIETEFVQTPNFSGSGYTKKSRGKRGEWLEVEVSFDWQPALRREEPIKPEAVKVNYYLLINNKPNAAFPKPILLQGAAEHIKVFPGKSLRSVAFVSPRDLRYIFQEKVPSTARAAVAGVGVTIEFGGKVVAADTTKGRGTWWADQADQFQQMAGVLVDKSKTPFAPLAADYHEPLK